MSIEKTINDLALAVTDLTNRLAALTEATEANTEVAREVLLSRTVGTNVKKPEAVEQTTPEKEEAPAEKTAKKANALYAQAPDPDDEARYYKARADATIEMIARMTGARL